MNRATEPSAHRNGRAANTYRVAALHAANAAAVIASLRRDREASYMVMISASLLVVPLLWDHYLATLIVPAVFLAQRLWTPLIMLPLLSWLPIGAPFLVLGTMVLTFLVPRSRANTVTAAGPVTGAEVT